jgi:poly(A) polymerase
LPINPPELQANLTAVLSQPAVQELFKAFAAADAEIRIVGGAVRDMVLGRPVSDLDLAVNRPPEVAEQILLEAGIKTKRTGFDHGTITAIISGRGYEITSLRRDLSTDGRHAEIAFTDLWQEDAARRDFTMNALYLGADGKITDFYGGIADAKAGRVIFIGGAKARIEEDYLRILRFFRFHAIVGQGTFNQEALTACAALAAGIDCLSRERVTQEWKKLLQAPAPLSSLQAMIALEISGHILPLQLEPERLRQMLELGADADFCLRQAALLNYDPLLRPVLNASLKLSQAEIAMILALLEPAAPITAENLPEWLYRLGPKLVRGRILLQSLNENIAPEERSRWLQAAAAWRRPVFPLNGDELMARGLPSGPELGKILKQTEDWWIAGSFQATREDCLSHALKLREVT